MRTKCWQTLAVVISVGLPGVSLAQDPSAGSQSLPAGARIAVTLEQPLTLSQSVVGARVLARVQESVRAGAGDAGIPAGTLVAATIAGVQKAHGRLIPAHVRLSFETITIGTKDYPLSATIESTSVPESASQQARPAGRSSFAGTAPGAILVGVNAEGGSRQQSLVSLGTNESSLSLPAGTVLHLRLRDALRVQR